MMHPSRQVREKHDHRAPASTAASLNALAGVRRQRVLVVRFFRSKAISLPIGRAVPLARFLAYMGLRKWRNAKAHPKQTLSLLDRRAITTWP